jgi:predicted RND superfamily exporter protein
MTSEFRKSINSILFERVASPLYGAFFISWLVWNWQIIYLTLFVNEQSIDCTKIEYIKEYYFEINYLVTFPVLSTLVLILVVPFISNGAYYVSLKFRQWRVNQKSSIEGRQRLTLERSIEIMKQINEKDREFDQLLEKKNENEQNQNLLIDQLNQQIKEKDLLIEELRSKSTPPKISIKKEAILKEDELESISKKIEENRFSTSKFKDVAEDIIANNRISKTVSDPLIAHYKLEELINQEANYKSAKLTSRGRQYYDFLKKTS